VSRQISRWAARRGLTEAAARARLKDALVGTPVQVGQRLRALEAAGVSCVFLLFQDLPGLASLRLFAEAVTPVLSSGPGE